MWMEQLQNGINGVVAVVISVVLMTLAKIYLEKIVFMKKLFDFLGHFVPASMFLMASSSREMCRLTGSLMGVTEFEGFFFLALMGFMSAVSTVMFVAETSRDYPVTQEKSNKSPQKRTKKN